jgi:protein prenyltransferase alpha subunit repeat containing protein 1
LALFTAEFLKLRRWIETHVSDHSAIHQYCNIVSRLQALDLPQYRSVLGPLADASVHFEHAISLVTTFPTHESLWMYLRAVINVSPNAEALLASAISSTAPLDGPYRDQLVLWAKNRSLCQSTT